MMSGRTGQFAGLFVGFVWAVVALGCSTPVEDPATRVGGGVEKTATSRAPLMSAAPPVPAPNSGYNVHHSASLAGTHYHYFDGATQPMVVASADSVYVWIYLDPDDMPSEVMLEWDTGSFWTRAWWGGTKELTGWTPNSPGVNYRAGSLPSSGGWTRLKVSTSSLNIAKGASIIGMDFALVNGSAFWGETGRLRGGSTEVPWVTDATPAGATLTASAGDGWNWIAPYRRDWLQFGGDPTHSGNNAQEMLISTQNMSQLKPISGVTFSASIGGQSSVSAASPVVLENAGGTGKDIAFFNIQGNVYAFDAYAGGAGGALWPPTAAPRTGGVDEAAPAIDPNLQYIYNIAGDGCAHKYAVGTGIEYTGAGLGSPASGASLPPPKCMTNGWPETILLPGSKWGKGGYSSTASEYAPGALTIGVANQTPYLYAGTCNSQGQSGHITAINLSTGTQVQTKGDMGTWARAGSPFDPQTQRLYVPTVDGSFDGVTGWGYSVVALNPDGSGPVDNFTPYPLPGYDMDFGSTNTLILPNNGSVPDWPHLAIQNSKDGYVRMIDLDNMSGTAGPIIPGEVNSSPIWWDVLPTVSNPSICGATGPCLVSSAGATWVDPVDNTVWVYANSPLGLNAWELQNSGGPYLQPMWGTNITTNDGSQGGVSVANGVLYYWYSAGLYACNARGPSSTCKRVGSPGSHKHQTPTVVNGMLYFNGLGYSVGGTKPVEPKLVNLALGRPSYTSSTASGTQLTANLGNDGNRDGNINNNSVFSTDVEADLGYGYSGGPWWYVDLGAAHQVSKVILYNRTDGSMDGWNGGLGGFYIYYWSGSTWLLLSDQSSFYTGYSTVVPVDVNVNAQFIMVQKANVDYFQLAEVEVLGQ